MKQEQIHNELLEMAESLLDDNHSLMINMKGFSMFPTLRPGDVGKVEKCLAEEVKAGDILVFKSNGKLIAHRLIRKKSDKGREVFITQGDNNSFFDQPFVNEELIGKITSFERSGKTISVDSFSIKLSRFKAMHFHKISQRLYSLRLSLSNRLKSLQNNISSLQKHLKIIGEGSKKLFIINANISVLQGLVPFVIIVCIKYLIDFLTNNNSDSMNLFYPFGFLLVLTASVFLLSAVLNELRSYFGEKLSQSVTTRIYSQLHAKHAAIGLSNYENPVKQDKMHRAVQEASFRPVKILNSLLTGIKSVASVIFLIGLFVSIHWYLTLLLVIAVLPGMFVRLRFSAKHYRLKDAHSTKERRMYYFNRILTGFPFAKELRLFGFGKFFKKQFDKVQKNLFEEKIALRKSEALQGSLAQVFAVALIFLSLFYVAYLKVNGNISIGTVVLFFFAFQRGYTVLSEFFRSFALIIEDNIFLRDFIDFLDIQNENTTSQSKPFSLTREIRFDQVSFSYDGSKRDVLKGLDLSIPVGKTIALVGANGSGKSTLIKLLCGFYAANQGKILFDNSEASAIGQQAICENIGAVFQDFAFYHLPVFDNLALGNITHKFDLEKAKNAAEFAGLEQVINKLPQGYHTLLGNQFLGGEELSIGQWQKMAIARAFYRDAPLLLLDEPASALDAKSETQIIHALRKLTKGKTAVIVSHRLRTVQWVDQICFMEDGRITEHGTHEELLKLQGRYFEMYQADANRVN